MFSVIFSALLAFVLWKRIALYFKVFSICRPNWKHDDSERSPVQSLEVSDNHCEDEDMDTYLSETEKEPEHNYQSTAKRKESFSNDAIYAVPYKNQKVGHLVAFSNFNTKCKNLNV